MFGVAVVGAGVAGCTVVMALAPTHKVALIDLHAEAHDRIGECLPPAARRILNRLDILQEFNTQPHIASLGMQAYWGDSRMRVVDGIRNPDGLGWHIDRRIFEQFLRDCAQQKGVNCYWPFRFDASECLGDHWRLDIGGGNNLKATFVIDAGGRHSPFARMLGVSRRYEDKLVARWSCFPDKHTSRMGMIAASKNGWWYSAPLPSGKRIMVYLTDAQRWRDFPFWLRRK